MSTLSYYQQRKQEGICNQCGNKIDRQGKGRCNSCLKKDYENTKRYRNNKIIEGKCGYCGKIREDIEKKLCNICYNKDLGRKQNRYRKLKKQKICTSCGKLSTIPNNTRCEDCWFKHIASKRTGSVDNWIILKNRIIQQNYLCYYTHRLLIIGKNASVDHIIPTSKGGLNAMENVQWVDKKINTMKNDMNHEEFLNTIQLILSNHP